MGEECCKRCCYSTPYATLFAVSVAIVGLVGFVAAAIYGVVMMNANEDLSRQVMIFAPILAGVVVLGVVPLLLATIMGYCVTGYIRDELYSNNIKRCIGPCCSFFVMLLNFIYLLVWILVAVALGAVLTVFVQLKIGCSAVSVNDPGFTSMTTCLPDGDYGSSSVLEQVCGSALQSLCSHGENAGLSFIVALGFSIVIVIGLMMQLMIQMGNYINARENMEYRRSYQPRSNGGNAEEDYAMKRVR